MKKFFLWVVVIITGTALGLGSALLVNRVLPKSTVSGVQQGFSSPFQPGDNRSRGWGMQMGPMYQQRGSESAQQGARISIDEAAGYAEKAINADLSGLSIREVMEFSGNFYVAVIEKETGRGAYELLVDPYTGQVSSEPGPNMMWNTKYGHYLSGGTSGDNTVTLEQAKTLAQAALDQETTGATLESDGISFYGYYTFDYSVNGNISGMLSVNGTTGTVWFHTWHGDFIGEKEFTE